MAGVELLSQACFEGDLVEVRRQLGTLSISIVNSRNSRGQTPLYCCCRQGHVSTLKLLLKVRGIKLTGGQEQRVQSSPLHAASYFNHPAVVALLLLAGADPNYRNQNGKKAEEESSISVLPVFRAYHEKGIAGLTRFAQISSKKKKSRKGPGSTKRRGSVSTPESVSSWTIRELKKYIDRHQLVYLRGIYDTVALAARANTNLTDASEFMSMLRTVNHSTELSDDYSEDSSEISSISGASRSSTAPHPWDSYFEIDMSATNMICLKQVSLPDLFSFLLLGKSDPLTVLWNRKNFLMDVFLSGLSLVQSDELFLYLLSSFESHLNGTQTSSNVMGISRTLKDEAVCRSIANALAVWLRVDQRFHRGTFFDTSKKPAKQLASLWNTFGHLNLLDPVTEVFNLSDDSTCKIAVIGVSNIGKGSLLHSIRHRVAPGNKSQYFTPNTFCRVYGQAMVKFEFDTYNISASTNPNKILKYLRDEQMHSVIFVYDVTKKKSFEKIHLLLSKVPLPLFVAGTHIDLAPNSRAVGKDLVGKWAEEMGAFGWEEYNSKLGSENSIDHFLAYTALHRETSQSDGVVPTIGLGSLKGSSLNLSSSSLTFTPPTGSKSPKLESLSSRKGVRSVLQRTISTQFEVHDEKFISRIRKLRDVSPLQFAEHFTAESFSRWKKISVLDLYSGTWTGPDQDISSPIYLFLEYGTTIQNKLLGATLSLCSISDIVANFQFLVEVAVCLEKMNSYFPLRHILEVLRGISLLEPVTQKIPRRYVELRANVAEVLSDANRANLNLHLKGLIELQVPHLPDISYVLSKIVKLQREKDYVDGLINFHKVSGLSRLYFSLLGNEGTYSYTWNTRARIFLEKVDPMPASAVATARKLRERSLWDSQRAELFKFPHRLSDEHIIAILTGGTKLTFQPDESLPELNANLIYFVQSGTVSHYKMISPSFAGRAAFATHRENASPRNESSTPSTSTKDSEDDDTVIVSTKAPLHSMIKPKLALSTPTLPSLTGSSSGAGPPSRPLTYSSPNNIQLTEESSSTSADTRSISPPFDRKSSPRKSSPRKSSPRTPSPRPPSPRTHSPRNLSPRSRSPHTHSSHRSSSHHSSSHHSSHRSSKSSHRTKRPRRSKRRSSAKDRHSTDGESGETVSDSGPKVSEKVVNDSMEGDTLSPVAGTTSSDSIKTQWGSARSSTDSIDSTDLEIEEEVGTYSDGDFCRPLRLLDSEPKTEGFLRAKSFVIVWEVSIDFIMCLCEADPALFETLFHSVCRSLFSRTSSGKVLVEEELETVGSIQKATEMLGSGFGRVTGMGEKSFVGGSLITQVSASIVGRSPTPLNNGTLYLSREQIYYHSDQKVSQKKGRGKEKKESNVLPLAEITKFSRNGKDILVKSKKKTYSYCCSTASDAMKFHSLTLAILAQPSYIEAIRVNAPAPVPNRTTVSLVPTPSEWLKLFEVGARRITLKKDARVVVEDLFDASLYTVISGSVSCSSKYAPEDPSFNISGEEERFPPVPSNTFGETSFINSGASTLHCKVLEDKTVLKKIPESWLTLVFECMPTAAGRFWCYLAHLLGQRLGLLPGFETAFSAPKKPLDSSSDGIELSKDTTQGSSVRDWMQKLATVEEGSSNQSVIGGQLLKGRFMDLTASNLYSRHFTLYPGDIDFLDSRLLTILVPLEQKADTVDVVSRFVSNLVMGLTSNIDLKGADSYTAKPLSISFDAAIDFLFQACKVSVELIYLKKETNLDEVVNESRLNAVVLVLPPKINPLLVKVHSWLKEERSRIRLFAILPPQRRVLDDKTDRYVSKFSGHALKTWDLSDWVIPLLNPLLESTLFEFSHHIPTVEVVISFERKYICVASGSIKVFDAISGRPDATLSFSAVQRILPLPKRDSLEEFLDCKLDRSKLLLVLMTRAPEDAHVCFTTIELSRLRPISYIEATTVLYSPALHYAVHAGNLFVSTEAEVLILEDRIISVGKPRVLSLLDGSSVNFFATAASRSNLLNFGSRVNVWNFTGRLVNRFSSDYAVSHIAGWGDCIGLTYASSSHSSSLPIPPLEEEEIPTARFYSISGGPPVFTCTASVPSLKSFVFDDDFVYFHSGRTILVVSRSTGLVKHTYTNATGGVTLQRDSSLAVSVSRRPSAFLDEWNPLTGNVSRSIPLSLPNLIQAPDFLEEITDDEVQWSRVKLFILGEENVGKTHLVKALRGEKYRNNMSTDGIAVEDLKSRSSSDTVEFRVIEFGGQEVFYPTHNFFLTPNAIYVIVFSLVDMSTLARVEYWLQAIASVQRRSSVLCVGTHLDGYKGSKEERRALEKRILSLHKGKFVKKIIFGTNLKQDLVKEVRAAVTQFAFDNFITKKMVPRQYLRVAGYFENFRHKYLMWDEYAAMLGYERREKSEDLKKLTNALHVRGSLLSFNETLLSDIVIFDMQWLSDVFASVVSFKYSWRDGKISEEDFWQIWKDKSRTVQNQLMGLLERFDILFPLLQVQVPGAPPPNRTWLIPCMFDETPSRAFLELASVIDINPDDHWKVERLYQFRFLPLGMFSRIVMRFLSDVVLLDLKSAFWKNGMVFYKEGGRGIYIAHDSSAHTVRVVATAPQDIHHPELAFVSVIQSLEAMLSSAKLATLKRFAVCPRCRESSSPGRITGGYDLADMIAAYQLGERTFSSHTLLHSVHSTKVPNDHLTPVSIHEVAPDVTFAHVNHITSPLANKTFLGEGAYGQVYRAELDGVAVAVKELRLDLDNQLYQEFMHEVTLMSGLSHPNIVDLLGIIISPLTMVMGLCDEGSLDTLLYQGDASIELTLYYRYKVARDVSAGMQYLHELKPPLAHRDLRSPNVFLTTLSDSRDVVARVGDFGLAQHAAPHLSDLLSTWQWLAPEVLTSINPKYDHTSDIFSYAIVFSELFTRQHPYSTYDQYVQKQRQSLSPKQMEDEEFLSQLEEEGVTIDRVAGEVVSEIWLEQKIKSAILEEDLRPLLPTSLDPAIRLLIESAWAPKPSERPTMAEITAQLDAKLNLLSSSPVKVKKRTSTSTEATGRFSASFAKSTVTEALSRASSKKKRKVSKIELTDSLTAIGENETSGDLESADEQ